MVLFPFREQSVQRAFSAVFSILGLFLTAIGLSDPSVEVIGIRLISLGFIVFLIGIFYLIEVTFK